MVIEHGCQISDCGGSLFELDPRDSTSDFDFEYVDGATVRVQSQQRIFKCILCSREFSMSQLLSLVPMVRTLLSRPTGKTDRSLRMNGRVR